MCKLLYSGKKWLYILIRDTFFFFKFCINCIKFKFSNNQPSVLLFPQKTTFPPLNIFEKAELGKSYEFVIPLLNCLFSTAIFFFQHFYYIKKTYSYFRNFIFFRFCSIFFHHDTGVSNNVSYPSKFPFVISASCLLQRLSKFSSKNFVSS